MGAAPIFVNQPLPADVRTCTRVTGRATIPSLVHVRTADWPERTAFLARVDELMRRDGYRHDSALAEAAGISHTALSNWRKGKVKPSLISVGAVARVFNEPPSALAKLAGLISDDGEPAAEPEVPSELQLLVRLYREADPVRRAELLARLEFVIEWFEATEDKPAPRRRAS